MNFPYLLGILKTLPFIPQLYMQAKQVRREVPELPEAEGPKGSVGEKYQDTPPLRLLILGESTMAGVGVRTHEEGFAGALATELAERHKQQVHWQVYARSGFTARQVRKQLVPTIEMKAVDLIVIGLGGNDAFTLNRPWRWKRELRQLITDLRIKFPAVPIVFCNMPPIRDFPAFTPLLQKVLGGLVEMLGRELSTILSDQKEIFYNEEVITIDGWNQKFGLTGSAKDYFSDGVHPSRFTYRVWATDMANMMESLNISRPSSLPREQKGIGE